VPGIRHGALGVVIRSIAAAATDVVLRCHLGRPVRPHTASAAASCVAPEIDALCAAADAVATQLAAY